MGMNFEFWDLVDSKNVIFSNPPILNITKILGIDPWVIEKIDARGMDVAQQYGCQAFDICNAEIAQCRQKICVIFIVKWFKN